MAATAISRSGGGFPAVILAAGRGERLGGPHPKPLTRLLGLTLLERAVLACRESGVSQFFVVIGHEKERVRAYVEEIGRRHGVSIGAIESPHWERGNGASALAARNSVAGPFLLLMADHVIDPAIPQALLEADDGSTPCLLGVDHARGRVFDLEDATKVRLRGEEITAIGKEVRPFDAVDTGVFLCRPPLFEALEQAGKRGDGSLTSGVRELIRAGRVRAVDIGEHWWTDVDTPQGLAHAKALLLARASRSAGDGPIARSLNRPLSRRISAFLSSTALTPNTVSLLSFATAALAAAFFAQGNYIWFLFAGLLTHLASVLDGCDGEIARLKFQSTPFGAWLDTLLDRYADIALIAGITYGRWGFYPDLFIITGSLLAASGFILYSYARKEYLLRYGRESQRHPLFRFAPASRDVRLFLIAFGATIGRPFLALLLASLLAHLSVALRLVTERRQKAAPSLLGATAVENGGFSPRTEGKGQVASPPERLHQRAALRTRLALLSTFAATGLLRWAPTMERRLALFVTAGALLGLSAMAARYLRSRFRRSAGERDGSVEE